MCELGPSPASLEPQFPLLSFPGRLKPSKPTGPGFRYGQGEDLKQLGEPSLHLPVPRASAWLCGPARRASLTRTPT
ncbi:hypothetical protein H8959_022588 [Pygathrix nigripes]